MSETLGSGAMRPPVGHGLPRGFEANMQVIASAAHRRGVTVMKGKTIVGTVEAACCAAPCARRARPRAARETTRGAAAKHDHVDRLINGIAVKIGPKGPVEISRQALNFLTAYARPMKNGGA